MFLAAVDVLFEVGKSAIEKSHRIRHAVAGCFGFGRARFLIALEGRLQGRFGLFDGLEGPVYVKILIVLQGVSQAKNEDSELIVGHPTEYNLLLFAGGGDLGGKEVVARGSARSDFFFQESHGPVVVVAGSALARRSHHGPATLAALSE